MFSSHCLRFCLAYSNSLYHKFLLWIDRLSARKRYGMIWNVYCGQLDWIQINCNTHFCIDHTKNERFKEKFPILEDTMTLLIKINLLSQKFCNIFNIIYFENKNVRFNGLGEE